MNRNEFYEVAKSEGLTKYNIGDSETVAEVTNGIGCIKKDGWIVYKTDERAQMHIISRCTSEEEGLDILLNELRSKKRKEEIFKKLKRMTFNELLEVTKDLDLKSMGVYLGEQANRVETISLWEESGEWILQKVDGRQRVIESRGKERDMVRKMYGNIKLRIR